MHHQSKKLVFSHMPRRKATPAQAAPIPKKASRRAPIARKKKTVSVTASDTASDVAPHAESYPSAPPPAPSFPPPIKDTIVKKMQPMTSTQCLFYGGIATLVGTIALGLLVGLVILPTFIAQLQKFALKSGDSQYSYAAPLTGGDPAALSLPGTTPQSNGVPEQEEFGFYGTVLSKEKDVVVVQELLPPLPLEKSEEKPKATKTFVVRVRDGTEYTYQKPREKDNVTAPLFTPEPGSLDQMKESMFVFVSSGDDPEKTETVQAQHILYSELSPFAE